jgi:cellobiose phosphorylase
MVYIISEFLSVCSLKKEAKIISDYEARLKKLKDRIRKTALSEDRYIRAITHSGRELGISKGKNASLFLDTQVWAIIAGLTDEKEANIIIENIEKQLLKDSGPVMVTPPFEEPDDQLGTIAKLPKGVMENGGISVEAACWTIWALTKLGRANKAWEIYTKLNPVDRSHKSDQYRLEPFVSCEYIDGPDSPTNGLARNSWYNRSGYWMFKVMTEDILGIKPTYDGLVISPCIPNRWRLFKLRRAFRNAHYTIEVINPRYVSQGVAEVIIDGKSQKSNIIPEFGDEKRHHVKVIMGKAP